MAETRHRSTKKLPEGTPTDSPTDAAERDPQEAVIASADAARRRLGRDLPPPPQKLSN